MDLQSDAGNILALDTVSIYSLPFTKFDIFRRRYVRYVNLQEYEGRLMFYYDFSNPLSGTLYD